MCVQPATKHLAKMGIDQLLEPHNLAQVPEALRDSVHNNGGGFVNHDFFWASMAPPGTGGEPSDVRAWRGHA